MDETDLRTPPAPATEHDDLLRRSLTESDDAIGFDRPWSPTDLLWIAFFGGLPAAGALYALNFRRLGIPGPAPATFAAAVILALVAQGYVLLEGVAGRVGPGSTRMYRFGLQVLALLFGLVVAGMQRRRFRLFETTAMPKGALLGPGLLAIAGSWVFLIAYGVVLAFLVRRPG